MRNYVVTFANGRRVHVLAASEAEAKRQAYRLEPSSAVAEVVIARAA